MNRSWCPSGYYASFIYAKQKGFIPSVRPALDAMISQGEGVQDDMYYKILESAGENPVS